MPTSQNPQEWHARLRENDSSAPLDVRGENTGGGIFNMPRWMEVGESLSKMVGLLMDYLYII